ncbi:MAG: NRDE family protein [Balneolaceae bacterium]
MCLIVFSFKQHNKYPFILAANRDELYDRPSSPARFWKQHPHLLAGKDEKLGGTWLGVTKQGKFAALTNYRDLNNIKKSAPSRGNIVKDFLADNQDPLGYLEGLKQSANAFNGFNLLTGSPDQLYHYSNETDDITEIKPGIHGISNAVLNTPWPKVETAKSVFEEVVNGENIDQNRIFKMLKNSEPYPENQLPKTGLSKEMEKRVSPIFIKSKDYGTRCSTLLKIRDDGVVTFIEKTYTPIAGTVTSETRFNFKIKS